MKIRIILIALSLLSIMIITIGGYVYYSSMKGEALRDIYEKDRQDVKIITHHIDLHLEHQKTLVELISKLNVIKNGLARRDPESIASANRALDLINKTIKASVSYLMDNRGDTIASSNRNDPDSFLGKNYSFRPYYIEAINNKPSIYIALGVTSGKLGIYLSRAVYLGKQDSPSGVAVLKIPIKDWLFDIDVGDSCIITIVDARDFIIMSCRDDLNYNFLWEPLPQVANEIAKSRQFGDGPFKWSGFKKIGDNIAVGPNGVEYRIHENEIKNFPGLKVVFLHNINEINKKISAPLFQTTGFLILIFCFLIGITVGFLFIEASKEIKKRKSAEDALQKSLGEKNMLLKEIHHRVKNNLTIIQSLLMLQMGEAKDEKSKGMFIQSQNRVRSISLIHEKLYRSDDSTNIDLSEYISSLVGELFGNYQVRTNWIKLNLNVPNIKLDIDTMIPCGLMINELISNVFKHAFPNGMEGELTVIMEKHEGKEILLVVKDNGIGLPENFDIKITESLGMQIVNSLVQQLNARMEIIRGKGTEFRITFPERSFRNDDRSRAT